MTQETFEQSFNVKTPAELVVKNPRGSILIKSGDSDRIIVIAVKHGDTGDADNTLVQISQDEDGRVVAVTQLEEHDLLHLSGNPCKVDYTIQVPELCNLEANSVSSSLIVKGVQGDMALNTVSGSVALDELSGTISINTVSGGLSGNQLSGSLELKSVSGDVSLRECQLNFVKASTVSGSVQINTPLMDGPYRFDSVSGDIRLNVPENTGCEFQMSTMSGKMHIGLSAIYHHHSRRQRKVTVQDGGPEVTVHSLSGDFVMETNTALPEKGDQAQPKGDSHMSILDRIANGEITVDEGIRLLEEE